MAAKKKLTTAEKNTITQVMSNPATVNNARSTSTANRTTNTAANNSTLPASIAPSMSNLIATNNNTTATRNTTSNKTPAATTSNNSNNTYSQLIGASGVGAVAMQPQTAANAASAASRGTSTSLSNALNSAVGAALGATNTSNVGNLLNGAASGVTTSSNAGNLLGSAATGGVINAATNSNNNQAKDTSLSSAIQRAAESALLNTPGSAIDTSKPYTVVPGAGSVFSALTGNPSVVATSALPDENKNVYNAMADAATDALKAYGVDTTNRGSVFEQIINPPTYPVTRDNYTMPALEDVLSDNSSNLNVVYDPTLGYGITAEPIYNPSANSNTAYYNPATTVNIDPVSAINDVELERELAPAVSIDDSYLRRLMDEMLGEYETNYNSLLEALLNQYNSNTETINTQYQNALDALGLNNEEALNLLKSNYSNSQEALEEQRRRELQEAYIRKMMDQKEMAESLAGYGLSGGATESVLANLLNNYRGNRNTINTNIDTSLKDLLANYLGEVSSANQAFNTSKAEMENKKISALQQLLDNYTNAQTSAANARTNYRANAESGLYDTLANLYLQDRQNAYNQYQSDLAYQRQIDMANLEAALNNQSKADLLTLEYALRNQYK